MCSDWVRRTPAARPGPARTSHDRQGKWAPGGCLLPLAAGMLMLAMSGCAVPSKLEALASQSPDDGRYECRDPSAQTPAQAVSVDVDRQRKQLLLHLADGHQERLDAVTGSPLFYANKDYAWHFANDTGFQQTQFGPVHRRRGAVLTDIDNVTRLNCARPGLFG